MNYPLTLKLAQALVGLRETVLDPLVSERAAIAFLDTVGVMIAARSEPAVAGLKQTLDAIGAGPRDSAHSALVDGTAAHALDFDDVAFGGHISAVLIPAIMAVAAPRGASIREVVLAYVAGYEAWAELAAREATLYHARGLHPTGLLGAVAASVAVGSLLRLDEQGMARALAIGASQGAGLMANFGSMIKPFHAGRAAQSGVLAAFLAQQEFTASPDALEAPNGFLASYSPAGQVDLERPIQLDGHGPVLGRNAPNIKRYPVCYAGHRAIDAVLELGSTSLMADAVECIEIRLSPRHSDTLRYRDPETVAQARFSLEFFAAAALMRGWVGLSELSDATLADPTVRPLMRKVERVLSHDFDPDLDGWARADRAALILKDGTRLESHPVRRPKGHAENPTSLEDVHRKFVDCLRSVGEGELAPSLFSAVSGLAEPDDGPIPAALRAVFVAS